MKRLKKIVVALMAFIVLSSIGGYFYFTNKFTPPENYLTVSGNSENIPIQWIAVENNAKSAMLLPITLEGINHVFYMQLDFGSPTTLFYSEPLQSIAAKMNSGMDFKRNPLIMPLTFTLGKMTLSSTTFKILNYGAPVDWEKDSIAIIGTIGTDLLEKRFTTLNFKENYCSFTTNASTDGFATFAFEKRRLLFPAKIGDSNLKLLYDSGTSGYQLITSHKEWNKYRVQNGKTKTEKGNSWGNTLTIITAPAQEQIEMATSKLDVTEVTYINGTSTTQNLLMKFSGMQGMIGNALFVNRIIKIDCKNEKFKIE